MSEPSPETPDTLLDALRAHPEWSDADRDAVLDRIVSGFPADAVVEAVRGRLSDLGGPDAEVLLRLVEANPRPPLLLALADALAAQPDLPPERAWEALAVLDGAGALDDFPTLAERWDELNEVIEEEGGSVDQLVDQIEDDPDGLWLALQGLGAVEPDVRAEIVAGLARPDRPRPPGPRLVELLRLLAYAHDPATHRAAVVALASLSSARGAGVSDAAIVDLIRHHPDRSVRHDLSVYAAAFDDTGPSRAPAVPGPRVVRSLVTAVDGRGVGTLVLGSVRGAEHVTAVFACDVIAGVVDVFGDVARDPASAGSAFAEFAENVAGEAVEGDHPFALGLLAGCLALCGPSTPPALRYWIEATAGPGFRPAPFPAEGADPAAVPFEEMARRTGDILDACPGWRDESPLTYELAEEIALRERGAPINPARDAGAFRFFFEHRLRGQLERYRRMLLWMAGLWRADGADDLSRSALALASQLSEAAQVVPGHPFAVALTARSLSAARDSLARGIDPRGRARR